MDAVAPELFSALNSPGKRGKVQGIQVSTFRLTRPEGQKMASRVVCRLSDCENHRNRNRESEQEKQGTRALRKLFDQSTQVLVMELFSVFIRSDRPYERLDVDHILWCQIALILANRCSKLQQTVVGFPGKLRFILKSKFILFCGYTGNIWLQENVFIRPGDEWEYGGDGPCRHPGLSSRKPFERCTPMLKPFPGIFYIKQIVIQAGCESACASDRADSVPYSHFFK